MAPEVGAGVTSEFAALRDLVMKRRSLRAFDPDRPVPDETIVTLLDMARHAPSAANAQPWEFIVIRDEGIREQIFEIYSEQAKIKRACEKIARGSVIRAGTTGFRRAPVYILVIGDRRTIESFPVRTVLEKGDAHHITNMANVNLLIHLGAAALGLATQWLSDVTTPYMAVHLMRWLDIPSYMEIYDMVPLGYPANVPEGHTPRRELDEMHHRNRYQQEKRRDSDKLEEFLWSQTRLGGYKSASASASADESDISTKT